MSVKWLTSKQLNKVIHDNGTPLIKASFLGVFAINTLPREIPPLPVLLIVNNDTSNLPGRHWKAVFISCERHGEVYDSLVTPISIALEHWMNRFTLKWTCSTKTVQYPLSPSCGAYVLHYILHRIGEPSLSKYTERYFVPDLHINELLIRHFMYNKLKK